MLNLGRLPGGTPVPYSTSPGEQALHILAEARVPCCDAEGRGERKGWFVLQAQMDTQARRIEQKYADMASTVVEETRIPERRDFRIEQLSLVWIGANEVH